MNWFLSLFQKLPVAIFIYIFLFVCFSITECIDLNISKYNQSIAVLSFVVILINPPIIFPSTSNGNLFTLAPESFWYETNEL